MTLHSLPLFVRLNGRPVILVGEGEAAEPKRRLLERAGAVVVGEGDPRARLAIVADDDAAVARLKARGVLVNAVDRPELCDFTLPAIVDRAPVLIAIGTGGVSAGLAAAVRQRLEAVLPASLGRLAEALHGARAALRAALPDGGARRRAIGAALAPGAALDPLAGYDGRDAAAAVLASVAAGGVVHLVLASGDPDELTLRQARWLAAADRVTHRADVPPAILDRARADAARMVCDAAPSAGEGLTVDVAMAR
ncbi:siroheme synthase [Sphingomonas sp. Leaf231]|uniref:precorrin-2 dehydrogenase/sirohydrochlorin ferrochelatase family protein n=1 Tax=Sphingomonas sp. Leaf231 TaxID=1736301 RepID=UPI0006F5309F|nr:bifunctional precorrin-2 dehydrogenase/sirohydrochlorin ferrochelatase [Sphingomonas sp. Leaf231]KQN92382.1 siroheme synthase [Sphingomonas sp. Leaf231]